MCNMKISQSEIVVETNISSQQAFTIVANAKAFNILSSSLYSNKIGAIIRELSTNARDSHIDAGNLDTPFDVKLPNLLDSTFSVRDYGTGMSHESIMQLYTTYFDSTKTHSDDFIGALGLGSKSPFSYTNDFSVISWYGGYESVYLCYMQKGYPNISFISKKESTEPNGIKISFNVLSQDMSSFYNNAKQIYSYFDEPLPQFVSSSLTIVKNDKNVVPIFPSNIYHSPINVTSSYVRQGCIAYPISHAILSHDVLEYIDLDFSKDDAVKNACIKLFVENRFCIDATIGEFDVAASREALSYEEQTFKSFGKYISQVFNNVYHYVMEHYTKTDTLIDFLQNVCADTRIPAKLITSFLEPTYGLFHKECVFNGITSKKLTMICLDFNKVLNVPKYEHVFYKRLRFVVRKKRIWCSAPHSSLTEVHVNVLKTTFVYCHPDYNIKKNSDFIRNSVLLKAAAGHTIIVIPIDYIDKMEKICNVVPAHTLQQCEKSIVQTSSKSSTNFTYYRYSGFSFSTIHKNTIGRDNIEATLASMQNDTNTRIVYNVVKRREKVWCPTWCQYNIETNQLDERPVQTSVFLSLLTRLKNINIAKNSLTVNNQATAIFLIKQKDVELFKKFGAVDINDVHKSLASFVHTQFQNYNKLCVDNSFDHVTSSLIKALNNENDETLRRIDLFKTYRCFTKLKSKTKNICMHMKEYEAIMENYLLNTYTFNEYMSKLNDEYSTSLYRKVLVPMTNRLKDKYPIVFGGYDNTKNLSTGYITDMRKYIVNKNNIIEKCV